MVSRARRLVTGEVREDREITENENAREERALRKRRADWQKAFCNSMPRLRPKTPPRLRPKTSTALRNSIPPLAAIAFLSPPQQHSCPRRNSIPAPAAAFLSPLQQPPPPPAAKAFLRTLQQHFSARRNSFSSLAGQMADLMCEAGVKPAHIRCAGDPCSCLPAVDVIKEKEDMTAPAHSVSWQAVLDGAEPGVDSRAARVARLPAQRVLPPHRGQTWKRELRRWAKAGVALSAPRGAAAAAIGVRLAMPVSCLDGGCAKHETPRRKRGKSGRDGEGKGKTEARG